VASGEGRETKPGGFQKLALLALGILLLALFVGFAIAEGIGDPSVPSGDVAVVENTPSDIGEISTAKLEHAIELSAAQAGEEKSPNPGDPKYEELKETAMKSTLEGIWIQGLAAEWGIEVTNKEVARELEKVKKESFSSEADFRKFLEEAHYTPDDVDERLRVQILSGELQEALKAKAPKLSQSEVENYYEAAKGTQFTQKPRRDIRLIVNKDRMKAEEARDAVSTDNPARSFSEKIAKAKHWENVAKKYSEETSPRNNGLEIGLRRGVQEGVYEEPLNAAFFNTPEDRVMGPIKAKRGYTVFEVVSVTPENVQELKEVEDQIRSTLTQRLEQEYFTTFVSQFNGEWTARTFCSKGYVMERCANYEGSSHPSTAPESCYEANPKGGRPEACPAPVFQLVPALPGTVSPLEPKGKPLAQRPVFTSETE
jgi:parvulin-like peptidyl-prolyl isomerase